MQPTRCVNGPAVLLSDYYCYQRMPLARERCCVYQRFCSPNVGALRARARSACPSLTLSPCLTPPRTGAFTVLPERTMTIIAPDLTKCQLKPYVAGKSLPQGQRVPAWGKAAEGKAETLR